MQPQSRASKLISGKEVSSGIEAGARAKVAELLVRGVQPRLAIVFLGEHADAASYRRVITRRAEALGVALSLIPLPAESTPADVDATIRSLNAQADLHGVLVQTPMSPEVRRVVTESLAYDRDAEGVTAANLGHVMLGTARVLPCTAAAALAMIEHAVQNVRGKQVVIVNNSPTIGRPLTQLLLQRRATVTVCNTGTVDLAAETRRAEVLVTAIGKPKFFGVAHVSPGAVVVDVGINASADGKGIVGDVDTDAVLDRVAAISPVPGGVGPVTTAILLSNVVDLAMARLERGG